MYVFVETIVSQKGRSFMVCGDIGYEEFRKEGIVESLEVQASQKPRAMLINGERFVVELKPFKVSEFDEGMLDHYFHSDYADHVIMRGFLDEYNTDSWSDEEERYAAMKELMRFYFVGEEKTLCLTFKNWTDGAEIPFPKTVTYSVADGCSEGTHLSTRGWRVEWEDGRKQSVHEGCFIDTDGGFFDFVQKVKAERKRRGTDSVIEVAGMAGDEPVGIGAVTYPLTVGRLTVVDPDWKIMTFEGKLARLSPQMKSVLKAMYRLGAKSEETAKTKRDILLKAGLLRAVEERSLANIFSSAGNHKKVCKKVFDTCIGKTNGRSPMYYLT